MTSKTHRALLRMSTCLFGVAASAGAAQAEVPAPRQPHPFPNASYQWRLDGPDIAPAITVEANGAAVARYPLDGSRFCEGEEDNCDLDGIFPIVLEGAPDEPVLGVVSHIGAHGQRLEVLRPLADKAQPVFTATADYALSFKIQPQGLEVTVDRDEGGGQASQQVQRWMPFGEADCPSFAELSLPRPAPLGTHEARFDRELRRIVSARDLDAFMALLTDDVLVSFGGNGGKEELREHWELSETEGRARFWAMLDRLLEQGAWADRSDPGVITYPWFFQAWAHDREAYGVLIAPEGTVLRAGPDDAAPILARLPFSVLDNTPPDGAAETVDWYHSEWLPVAGGGQCLAYASADAVMPLLGTRLLARRDNGKWKIEAIVAGD